MKASRSPSTTADTTHEDTTHEDTTHEDTTHEDATTLNAEPSQNPLFGETPWFLPLSPFRVPLRVNEAANTAFATRFCQAILPSATKHLPRLQYPSEKQIMTLAETNISRPSPTQARFLIQTALANLNKCLHVVRKSSVWALLETFMGAPSELCMHLEGKIYALFALGELYSCRYRAPGENFPGLAYFSIAFKTYSCLLERPCVDSIEVLILLCLYSLCINRWHSAYFLASSAVRHCAVMGLQFDIPKPLLRDNAAREHIRRIWWTSYILEHTCALGGGQLVSALDGGILVDFPSFSGLSDAEKSDFENPNSMTAMIQLVRLSQTITKSLYGREEYSTSFLQRVQSRLRDLQNWFRTLPEDLKMTHNGANTRLEHVKSLHLFFNRCVILTTRPLLLHMIRMKQTSKGETMMNSTSDATDNIHTLSNACIRAARHSHTILTESWIDGSFKPFEYSHTEYLFSVAVILAISGLLSGPGSSKDQEDFDLACQLMQDLRKSGSTAATEFCQHIEAMRRDIENSAFGKTSVESTLGGLPVNPNPVTTQTETVQCAPFEFTAPMTADIFLSEPSLEGFLSQDDPSSEQLDYLDISNLEGLYWPVMDFSGEVLNG
ncbi:fungal specific transcription factor domain-containing protein [Colletotrichum truncatum]|uniref:Fungal specific transcription factor domain-containing protein n=1 Tax=Colletotrichum truncatum TaxID=5467 RepID=A0ACC3YFJ5_COLTU